MNKLFIAVCFLFVASYVSAEFDVYYDKNTSEVEFIVEDGDRIRLSESDKTRLKKKTIGGNIRDFELTNQYTDYKFNGNNFIVNTKKISDRVNKKEADVEKEIQKRLDQESAKIKLMNVDWTPLTEAEFNSLIE